MPATFVDKALELFGPGTKIAIEAVLMATDAGALEDGKEVVTLGGTYKGLDTALVVKTCWSGDFLQNSRCWSSSPSPAGLGPGSPNTTRKAGVAILT